GKIHITTCIMVKSYRVRNVMESINLRSQCAVTAILLSLINLKSKG
ncbi:MAG: hypothetical protein ACI8SJ_001444, partial [Shewanella sp.]